MIKHEFKVKIVFYILAVCMILGLMVHGVQTCLDHQMGLKRSNARELARSVTSLIKFNLDNGTFPDTVPLALSNRYPFLRLQGSYSLHSANYCTVALVIESQKKPETVKRGTFEVSIERSNGPSSPQFKITLNKSPVIAYTLENIQLHMNLLQNKDENGDRPQAFTFLLETNS